MTDIPEDFKQLMRFYGVDTVEELVRAQENHIVRLQEQAKRPSINQILASSPVRSG